MCNSRKLWLWLCVLALIILIILCTILHTESIYEQQNVPQKTPIEKQVTKKAKDIKASLFSKDEKITNIKIQKNINIITISGLFGSNDTLEKTINRFTLYFSPVKKGEFEIREDVNDTKWLDIMKNMAYYFSTNIETGVLQYSTDGLYLEGKTLNEGAKEDINSVLSLYKKSGMKINDSIHVIEASSDTQKIKKSLYELLRSENIEFENGKSALKPDAFVVLDKIVAILSEYPTLNIIIEGHTDNTGNKTLNETLSLERAYSVKEYLVQKGINEERLSTKGYGQSRPILPNTNEENMQKNRRVEFKVQKGVQDVVNSN